MRSSSEYTWRLLLEQLTQNTGSVSIYIIINSKPVSSYSVFLY